MSALALESEPSRLEFGSGLRARMQLVRSGDLLLTLPELSPRPEPLGELLVEAGLVTPVDLERALEQAKERRRRLGEVLLEQNHLRPDDLVRLLGEQRGMPFLDLAQLDLDPAAVRLMPAATARLFKTLPVGFASGRPVVAVGDPTDELALARVLSFVREARFVASSDAEILSRVESLGP
jgi:Type II secretion system (T2SS), protein E, N-terminal domain